ncbi:MAG TPA: VWA domain-containing protein, partial [Thermoanaerobaculia bacterium]
DFVILEDNKPQTLTNFAEYEDAVPSEEAANTTIQKRPPRHIVLLLDDVSVDPFVRTQLFDSISKAVPKLVEPGDELMLATWSGTLHIRQPFTGDVDAVLKAIREDKDRGGGLQYMASTHSALDEINGPMLPKMNATRQTEQLRTMIRMWAAERLGQQKDFVAGAKRLISTIAGTEGRKLLVIATGYMPVEPGAELYEYAATKYPSILSARGTDTDMTAEHQDLANFANASGVAIDSIYPNLDLGAEGSERMMDMSRSRETFVEVANTSAALNNLAKATGGTAFTQVRDFDKILDNFSQQLSSYYSLGYRSPSPKGTHTITAQLRNHPEYRVVSRETYTPKTADDMAKDRAVANLFRDGKADFEVHIDHGAATKQGRNRYIVPLRVLFPNKLVLLPEGNEFTGHYTLYIAVADHEGDLAPVNTREQPIRLSAQQKAQIEGKTVGNMIQLLVRGGEQTVSIVVRDDNGGSVGAGRIKIKPDA